MDAELPCVAERLDLLDLARGILELAVLDVPPACGNLPVASEFDPVRRIDVDHLDLAAKGLPFSEARHDIQRIAEDHSIGPVRLVLVVLDEIEVSKSIEAFEKRHLGLVLG